MVKLVRVLLLVMACAVPAFAQDYPQFEIAMGYGNTNLSDLTEGRHSGFVSHQTFNLTSIIAVENFFGYYGLGSEDFGTKAQLMTNTFGGRFNYRTSGPVLYASAGLGAGWLRFPDLSYDSYSAFAFRFGGGIDVPINDALAWKVDVNRTSFHFDLVPSATWNSGINISTGIVLRITQ